MVSPRPARERAMISPAKRMTRTVKPPIIATIGWRGHSFSFSFLVVGPSRRKPGYDPPQCKQHQAVDQRSEMISVRKESHSFGRIGELKEA